MDLIARQVAIARRSLLWPIVPLVLAGVLVWGLEGGTGQPAPKRAVADGTEQVKKSIEPLARKLDDQRKLAQDRGLRDAERIFERLQQGVRDAAAAGQRKEALLKLRDLAQELHQRRAMLGGVEQVRRELSAMRDLGHGPADKLARALSRGKFHEAGRLQEQLDKLLSQLPQLAQSKQLARQLGRCSKCLQEGKGAEALEALGDIQSKLAELQRDADELQMLDDSLSQLAQTRDQMTCGKCGGRGCSACQGGADGLGQGDGLGKGPGAGDRPERKTDIAAYDTQVRQKVGAGSATITEMVPAPNPKGDVRQQIQSAAEAVRQGRVDPLTERRMPRAERDHAREYFDRIRKGE